ncbi:hypothetical protein [Prochlorothrix hollandica]|nr:hypothetical protein [Prochlorothrix hollandica]
MVAPVVGPQEGRHGGTTPTHCQSLNVPPQPTVQGQDTRAGPPALW